VGAAWVQPSELSKLKLRGREPLQWIPYVEAKGFVAPITLLTREGEEAPNPSIDQEFGLTDGMLAKEMPSYQLRTKQQSSPHSSSSSSSSSSSLTKK
jgi:hypothetical protein